MSKFKTSIGKAGKQAGGAVRAGLNQLEGGKQQQAGDEDSPGRKIGKRLGKYLKKAIQPKESGNGKGGYYSSGKSDV